MGSGRDPQKLIPVRYHRQLRENSMRPLRARVPAAIGKLPNRFSPVAQEDAERSSDTSAEKRCGGGNRTRPQLRDRVGIRLPDFQGKVTFQNAAEI